MLKSDESNFETGFYFFRNIKQGLIDLKNVPTDYNSEKDLRPFIDQVVTMMFDPSVYVLP